MRSMRGQTGSFGFALALLFVGLLALVPRTMAQGCHIEPMPAATMLLLPYFEVDQAWVTASLFNGSVLTGVDAMRLDSACKARHSGL